MENKWYQYSIKAVDRFSSMGSNWSKLSEEDREVAALWKLEADLNNGGFIQFFCNWGYEAYQYAIKGLEKIKAYNMLKITVEFYSIIARLEKVEMNNLWDIPALLNESESEALETLDEKFWKYPDDISSLAYNHYCKDKN